MAFINLLPWREEAEKAKEREYFTILTVVAVVAFAIVFFISQFYQIKIDLMSKFIYFMLVFIHYN